MVHRLWLIIFKVTRIVLRCYSPLTFYDVFISDINSILYKVLVRDLMVIIAWYHILQH
jgi:hypothetical protein